MTWDEKWKIKLFTECYLLLFTYHTGARRVRQRAQPSSCAPLNMPSRPVPFWRRSGRKRLSYWPPDDVGASSFSCLYDILSFLCRGLCFSAAWRACDRPRPQFEC